MSVTSGRGIKYLARFFVVFPFAVILIAHDIGDAQAHFLLNVNIRLIHVVHEQDRIRLLIRLPMPYLVADKLGAITAAGTPEPAPYTRNHIEADQLVHYLNADKLRRDPNGLAQIIADGLVFATGGNTLIAEIGRVRAYPARKQAPFALLSEAEAALSGPVYADRFEETYVGDTIVDAELIYPAATVSDYTLRSTLNPGLPKQEETANLIVDHATAEPRIFRVRGLMSTAFEVSNSVWRAVWTFVQEGGRHILTGVDHMLFVFCLVLGATTLNALVWRITGFTIGHSITLSVGFFGYVPTAAWFIPLVEIGIAASIIYAAVIAIMALEQRTTALITALIGLLHGLGFAFVLQEILQINAPNLWQSLLAFNLGIEIGQLTIALLIWPILLLLAKMLPQFIGTLRWILALPCIVIAAIWVGERTTLLVANL